MASICSFFHFFLDIFSIKLENAQVAESNHPDVKHFFLSVTNLINKNVQKKKSVYEIVEMLEISQFNPLW